MQLTVMDRVYPIPENPGLKRDTPVTRPAKIGKSTKTVTGIRFFLVNLLMGLNLIGLSLWKYKNPFRALRVAAAIIRGREAEKITYRKMVSAGNRYFINLNAPGWPSKAFNRCMQHAMDLQGHPQKASLFTLVISVTNKCGFKCEHCFEWEKLNRKDTLGARDITEIIKRFHGFGVSQVQFSGGEPFMRLPVILDVLEQLPKGMDSWIYTNGYHVTAKAAAQLKERGLTGVIISLDHHEPALHDRFRGIKGSWQKAMEAAGHITRNGLTLAFSLCATNAFITDENLLAYATLCRDAGASFIQFMEPEAAGNYKGKEVWLTKDKREILERAFDRFNFEKAFTGFPVVTYPKMVQRRDQCPFAAYHAVYVDADGNVQACPFCKKTIGSAFDPDLGEKLVSLKQKGCTLPDRTEMIANAFKTTARKGNPLPVFAGSDSP